MASERRTKMKTKSKYINMHVCLYIVQNSSATLMLVPPHKNNWAVIIFYSILISILKSIYNKTCISAIDITNLNAKVKKLIHKIAR